MPMEKGFFDVEGARKAGYSDPEIAEHLAQQKKFDAVKARAAGYSDVEIIEHLQPKTFSQKTREGHLASKFIAGLPEAALSILTNAGKAALAGGAGLEQIQAKMLGVKQADPAAAVEHAMNVVPSFEPKSEYGKNTLDTIATPFEKLEKVKQTLGDVGMNPGNLSAKPGDFPEVEYGSPAVATALHMIPDAALALLGVKGPGAVKAGAKPLPLGSASAATEIIDLLRSGDKGAERILTRHQRREIGDTALQREAVDALEGPSAAVLVPEQTLPDGTVVPASQPTAAGATSKTDVGTVIASLEQAAAKRAGGSSVAFNKRLRQNQEARTAAGEAVENELGPVRDKILDDVNTKKVNGKPAYRADGEGGFEPITGVDPAPVVAALKELQKRPSLKGVDAAQDPIADLLTRISVAKNKDGLIDAHELYGIRKTLGWKIAQTQSKPLTKPAPGSKRLARLIQKETQLAIDDAIEAAGGSDWKTTIKKYADRKDAIDRDAAREKNRYKPLQRTNTAGPPIGQQAKPESPNLLSRTAMFANFLLKKAGRDIQPKIDRLSAERYLEPEKLAAALRGADLKGPRRVSAKGAAMPAEELNRRLLADLLRSQQAQ